MQYLSTVFFALLFLPAAGWTFDSVGDPRSWAITGLNVVDVVTGEIVPNQVIVIESGTIEAVKENSEFDPRSVDLAINLAGQYVIPGLWDMHVHIRGGPDVIDANERWLPQYVAFGVTSVRDAGGDLPNSVLHWKAEIQQGTLPGPRIYSALRKIDGKAFRQSGSIPAETQQEIRAALDYLELAGADFVKLYDFSLPSSLFAFAVREAESRGLKTSAHVPPRVSFVELVEAGLDSVEHSFYLAKAANPDDQAIAASLESSAASDYAGYFRMIADIGDGADDATAREVFERMASTGTAVVSTVQYEQLQLDFLSGNYEENPRAAETPEAILRNHAESLEFDRSLASELLPSARKLTQQVDWLLELAVDRGVTVLAGTDTGWNNPLLYPGDSLHLELVALVEIGLSPMEALRTATVNPARWMKLYPRFGSISEGAAADLVIVAANPLEDIGNTRRLVAVVQQGVYLDNVELEKLKRLGIH